MAGVEFLAIEEEDTLGEDSVSVPTADEVGYLIEVSGEAMGGKGFQGAVEASGNRDGDILGGAGGGVTELDDGQLM